MRFSAETKLLEYVSGRSFVVRFEIFDNWTKSSNEMTYNVQVNKLTNFSKVNNNVSDNTSCLHLFQKHTQRILAGSERRCHTFVENMFNYKKTIYPYS